MPIIKKQSGLALVFFILIVLGFVLAGYSGLLTSKLQLQKEQARLENTEILRRAKEALLSYAVNYSVLGDFDKMGKLPCPDSVAGLGTEGNQDPACGGIGVNQYGYFPFKSLGLGKLEDASNECLWYVVSGDYKYQFNPPNPANGMLNRDSVGYLNLLDEDDNLLHDNAEPNFPVAFIISPGAVINQDRTPVAALPSCRANYTLSGYLEGGPNINYTLDLPLTADTLWEILSVSAKSNTENMDYNDQVIAVYRNEIWDRVELLGDLSTDNPAVDSSIELLTQSLAECIAAYGNEVANTNRLLPYPAPVDLDPANLTPQEYSSNVAYNDDAAILFGRFPQVLDGSVWNTGNLVLDTTAAASYCEGVVTTAYDELFWKNWKDHFFYAVSEDFESGSVVPADNTRCTVNGCFTIDGKVDKVAAMVVYADRVEAASSRVWWWDDATATAIVDEKGLVDRYLEGDFVAGYAGGTPDFDLTTAPNDYAWCIEYDNTAFNFNAIKCADLDNTL